MNTEEGAKKVAELQVTCRLKRHLDYKIIMFRDADFAGGELGQIEKEEKEPEKEKKLLLLCLGQAPAFADRGDVIFCVSSPFRVICCHIIISLHLQVPPQKESGAPNPPQSHLLRRYDRRPNGKHTDFDPDHRVSRMD